MGPLELLVVSAALQAAGTVLQKHRVSVRRPGVSLGDLTRRFGGFFRPLVRDPYWVAGGLLGLVGALVGLQALAALDLSVVKALGRIETLFVIGAGVVLLRERVRGHEAIGLLLLLAGSLAMAFRAGEVTGDPASLRSHLILVGGVTVGLAALAVASRRGQHLAPEIVLAASAGILFGTGDILVKGATSLVKQGGDFSVVESASMGGLVQTPEFGIAVLSYVTGGILMQAAFSVGRVSVIGPVAAIGGLVLPIAFALAVLREDAGGDRVAGMVAIALGIAFLGFGPRSVPPVAASAS
jgi:uncharacterized membrane protein